ncbi:MAG: hypothetical protein PHE24_05615 [Patescibacteria group bacterium]|nr:hypothetical protein [Patescibacteria group bacterium]
MRKNKIAKGIVKSNGNIPVVLSIIVLVAFIAGLLLGSLVIAKAVGGKNVFISQMTGSFADGYNAAKKKLADVGMFVSQSPSLSGQITKVSGNEITFTAPLPNPLDDESLKTRIAVVSKDTVITLYRLKPAEKAASDLKEGQAEMAVLQTQMAALQTQLNKCMMPPAAAAQASAANGPSEECQAASKSYNEAIQKSNQAGQKMDAYEKVDKAAITDLKAGMQISVLGQEIKQADNQTAPMAMTGNFADISQQAKFTVSQVTAREAPAISAPNPVNVLLPASTTAK